MAWPSTPTPNKETFVSCRFDPLAAADLDAAAAHFNMSKSAFIRYCVRRVIAHERAKEKRLRTGEQGET